MKLLLIIYDLPSYVIIDDNSNIRICEGFQSIDNDIFVDAHSNEYWFSVKKCLKCIDEIICIDYKYAEIKYDK